MDSRRCAAVRVGMATAGLVGMVLAVSSAPAGAQTVSIGDARAPEGDDRGVLTFTVSVSPASESPIVVDYWTADEWDSEGRRAVSASSSTITGRAIDGQDFVGEAGTLRFAPGETAKTIEIQIEDDGIREGEEAFLLAISAHGADQSHYRAFGVILDDEPPPWGCGPGYCLVRFPILRTFDEATGAWRPGAGSARVTAIYERPDDSWSMEDDWWSGRRQRIWIGYLLTRIVTSTGRVGAAQDGAESDYECNERFDVHGSRRRLSDVDLYRHFDLSARCVDAADRSCRLDLLAYSGYDPPYGCWDGAPAVAFSYSELQQIASIAYSEAGYQFGPATFDASSQVFVSTGHRVREPGTMTFTVSLDVERGSTTSVDYATVDGTAVAGADYVASHGSLVFGPGQLSTTVAVTILDDRLDEPDETFRLVLSNPVGATLLVSAGTATVEDDDVLYPNLVVSDLGVARAVTSGAEVTVRYEVQNAGEAPAPASRVAIALSPDRMLGTDVVPSLAPGATATGAAVVTLPALGTGAYSLVVLADSSAEVLESREWDNTATKLLVSGADLKVSMAPPAGVVAGAPFGSLVRVRNVGSEAAAASVIRLYRSPDGSLDATDVLLGEGAVPTLAPRASSTTVMTAVLPAGTWWLIARADTGPDARDENDLRRLRLVVP